MIRLHAETIENTDLGKTPNTSNSEMRKLKLQVQITVDGFVGGPGGELDWMTWNWDDKLKDHVTELNEPVDCVLLGRKMTDGFISHWAKVAEDPTAEDYWAGRKFTDTPKVVFTKTLETSEWPNTVLAKGDLVEEVNSLKNQEGKDIIVYGGAEFVSSLIKHNLIDEYHLFVNPVAIGKGLTIFGEIGGKFQLKQIAATPYECGVTVHQYIPAAAAKSAAK